MNSNTHQKSLECAETSIIGGAVDQKYPKNRRRQCPRAFAIALVSAISLGGCNADNRLHDIFSNDGLLTTRDAVFGSFAACLLPGNQANFTDAYSGPAGECRLR